MNSTASFLVPTIYYEPSATGMPQSSQTFVMVCKLSKVMKEESAREKQKEKEI